MELLIAVFVSWAEAGVLMLTSAVVGDAHLLPRKQGGIPFMVGQVDSAKGYVHLLDDTTLDILLNTLDTAADLLAYLLKKEDLVKNGIAFSAAGEEELLAHYLTHLNANGEYDFVYRDDVNAVTFDQGSWHAFKDSPQRVKQLKANVVSYVWDDIIERFTHHFLQGTSRFLSEPTLSSQEQLLRFFAREPRVRRRMLSATIVDMAQTTPPHSRRLRVIQPSRLGDPYFVLLVLPVPTDRPYAEYRDVRLAFLQICCPVVKLDFPEALDIVGLATEAQTRAGSSEDAVYFDARIWTEEMASNAKKDKTALRILTTGTRIHDVEYDYPS